MATVITVVVLVSVAVVVAFLAQRKPPEAPSQPLVHQAPAQLDRSDFVDVTVSTAEWLVVLFSSTTCDSCVEMVGKVEPIGSSEVDVFIADTAEHREIHKRYKISGVPVCVIADADGVVQRSFVGPTSATHLWGALAELREPGSVPPGCDA